MPESAVQKWAAVQRLATRCADRSAGDRWYSSNASAFARTVSHEVSFGFGQEARERHRAGVGHRRFGATEERADAVEVLVVAGLRCLEDLGGVLVDLVVRYGKRVALDLGRGFEEGPPDEAVAAHDVMVEEGQRRIGNGAVDPEGNLGELDGEGVFVRAVDAAGQDVAPGNGDVTVGGFDRRGPLSGDGESDPVDGTNEERCGAASRVDDPEIEQERPLGPLGRLLLR